MITQTLSRWARSFTKNFSRRKYVSDKNREVARSVLEPPEFDYEYFANPANRDEIRENLRIRRVPDNADKIAELHEQWKGEGNESKRSKLLEALRNEARKMPNTLHPDVRHYGREAKRLRVRERLVEPEFEPREFVTLADDLKLLRTEQLTALTGRRSYFFIGDLAELEHALVNYTLSRLARENFQIISVPDIIRGEVINACGMATDGVRTQVYQLDDSHGCDMFLSGTSEIALASLHSNSIIDAKKLPLCLAATSRCHRAEVSTIKDEKWVFRVHNFTKVEMFGVCHPSMSEELFHKFVAIQESLFESLGLDYQVLDMPPSDFSHSAHRKIDVEAWFPGRGSFGEISSCSLCTDYQSRRLGIRFADGDGDGDGGPRHAHTINGTACAVPRTVMAVFETHQTRDGNIRIPEPLRKFFNGREEIQRKPLFPVVREETESRSY